MLNPIVLQFGEQVPNVNLPAVLKRLSLPVALALGLFAGLGIAPAWSTLLRMLNATPFGIVDPVFSRDVGFYVFTLPGLSLLLGVLTGLVTISLLMLVPLYWLRGDLILRPG